jgi:hypothetical protein
LGDVGAADGAGAETALGFRRHGLDGNGFGHIEHLRESKTATVYGK